MPKIDRFSLAGDQEHMNKLIQLGWSRKAHGLKGHAIFHLFSGQDTLLEKGSRIILKPLEGSRLNGEQVFEIEELHLGNDVRVKLSNILDRTELEKILPFEVYCDEEDLPELEDGDFYVSDLLGLEVINLEGKKVGTLFEFYETAAHSVFVVKTNRGDLVDVPYVDAFFKEVDIKNARAIVAMPEEI